MIVTNNPEIAEMARLIRDQGQKEKYHHPILGFNFRMTEITASIGLEQLEIIGELNSKRRSNARFLDSILAGKTGITPPYVPEGVEHVYHIYAAKIDSRKLGCDRERVLSVLNQGGIEAQPAYPLPIYKQPLYRNLKDADRNPLGCVIDFPSYADVSCPITEELVETLLILPVHPSLTDDDLGTIQLALKKI